MTDSKIIPFGKKDTPQYLSNRAKCLTCRHEWIATAPVGTTWLDCPACHLQMGRFVGPVRHPEYFLQCACGNDSFYVSKQSVQCIVCGVTHEH